MQLDIWRDVPTRIDDHRPRQICDFPGAEPCFDRQQDNNAIANWVSGRGGVGEEGLYVVIEENFCLLACHANAIKRERLNRNAMQVGCNEIQNAVRSINSWQFRSFIMSF